MCIILGILNISSFLVLRSVSTSKHQFPLPTIKSIFQCPASSCVIYLLEAHEFSNEFSGFREIEKELNCTAYFCDSYCAWRKGTNENTNGLLREFYPKGVDFSQVGKTEFKHIIQSLNNRARKCIKYKIPQEELLG